MGERGNTPMAGQDVRLINLTADAGAGQGIFQNLHGKKNAAEFAGHLLTVTKQRYYGTAARAFIEHLVKMRAEQPEELARLINQQRQAFIDHNLPQGSDGQVASVVKRFSLFAAAGTLAQQWGILPWPTDEANKAATAGFQSWLADRGGTGASEDTQAVRTVRAFLELHEESRFALLTPAPPLQQSGDMTEKRSERPTINRAGFRREIFHKDVSESTGFEYLIFPEVWCNEVCKGLDPRRAAKALFDQCFLSRDKGQSHWTRVHRIPGLGLKRFYTIDSSIFHG